MSGEGKEIKKPVSREIVDQAKVLSEKACSLNDRVQGKLIPVMLSLPVAPPPEGKVMREYPPLFAELRELFITIDNMLNGINEALTRTEL